MIRGSLITLRPAEPGDRRPVYDWMARSDITPSMMGPPDYPEIPIPTWHEFCADYQPFFFDGTQPETGRSYIIVANGEPVGHVSYSQVESSEKRTELDIWLRSESFCGHGYGADALAALCHHLHDALGLAEFIIRPSARNKRAIRSYANAGFELLPLSGEEQTAIFGPPEHHDTVVLRKRNSVE